LKVIRIQSEQQGDMTVMINVVLIFTSAENISDLESIQEK